ncbi:MAG: DUF2235 domain-containing protein [Methylococcales bacterium]|nr:DUF2235 domain-containing protein [Methylococcales bacterium]
MNNLKTKAVKELGNLTIILICIGTLLSGCASTQPSTVTIPSITSDKGHPVQPHKNIFVFLDGTANDEKSATNVWRLNYLIKKDKNPQTVTIYIKGVGVDQSKSKVIFGKILGKDMQKRILEGYDFIAQQYHSGDDVYIFGFSRGAHTARALAGFIAYAGVPVAPNGGIEAWKKILKLTKKKKDQDYLNQWTQWKPEQAPLLAKEIKDKLNFDMQTAEIKFLGIWDTVPGSQLKNYGECKELLGIKKRLFDEGERYKTDSYPPIRYIAHAVSLDEKRSEFKPLLLCPPINSGSSSSTLKEVWFSGAHSDVGGGYDDCNGLSGISLNWMIEKLAKNYKFTAPLESIKVKENVNVKGLAHWSIGDFPGNINSRCEDRIPPKNPEIHPSVEERKNSAPVVPVRIKGKIEKKKYPLNCSDVKL